MNRVIILIMFALHDFYVWMETADDWLVTLFTIVDLLFQIKYSFQIF